MWQNTRYKYCQLFCREFIRWAEGLGLKGLSDFDTSSLGKNRGLNKTSLEILKDQNPSNFVNPPKDFVSAPYQIDGRILSQPEAATGIINNKLTAESNLLGR